MERPRYGVAWNYLEAPYRLLTSLLGHLLGEIPLQAGLVLLVGRGISSLSAKVGIGAWLSRSVNPGIHAALFMGYVIRRSAISSGGTRFSLRLRPPEGLGLLLQIFLGEIGSIMPGVVLGGTIDLGQLLFRRPGTIGNIGSGIADHVSEENGGIAHCVRG
jgi:hypothetical protein